jgi:tRNA (uracil-5-)-methyltransferase
MPPILETVGSPLQYGYRTKITPHFDAPPKKFQKAGPPITAGTEKMPQPEWLKIGFNHVGKRDVMDIEVCLHFVNECGC